MHIAVIGSTGSTGVALIPQALEKSHHLHLLARDPNKIPSSIRSHANVTVVKGDVNSAEEIKRIVHASEITIIVVGAYENKPTTVHQDAVRSVLKAFETKTGPKRVINDNSMQQESKTPMDSEEDFTLFHFGNA
jgi:putative NADH-flavin reductase